MSLSKDKKIIASVIILILFAGYLVSRFIGPRIKDYSTALVNGYSYKDAGHYEKVITFSDGKSLPKIVVDSRVDDYLVYDSIIYVARRPREIYDDNGVTNSRLANECEYFVINTEHKSITQVDSAKSLRCR